MLPNRLLHLRQAHDLTLRQVADRINTTERTVNRWERGEVAIPDRQKLVLAALFGVSVSWLMGWEDDNGNGAHPEKAA